MQDLIVQPEGTISLALNRMNNASFTCECTVGDDCQPYWSLDNDGVTITTTDNSDKESLVERGITFGSGSTTAFITIPDTEVNNNTLISCAAFLMGGTEFSDPPVELIIIGESQ